MDVLERNVINAAKALYRASEYKNHAVDIDRFERRCDLLLMACAALERAETLAKRTTSRPKKRKRK